MNNYTGKHGELNFEEDFVEELVKAGWKNIIKNPTVKDLEENFRQIVNQRNLKELNDEVLTDNEFNELLSQINNLQSPVDVNNYLISTNKYPIYLKRDNGKEVYLNLFDSRMIGAGDSIYQIAEQVNFETDKMYNNRRGDITLLINGLPLIHIELKASGVEVEQATNQIQKYVKEGVFTGLFNMVQVFFAITPEDSLYFANYGKWENANPAFYFHWMTKDNKPIKDWRQLCKGPSQILSIPEAHKLIGYYVVADKGKNVLKVLRSYQYYAINAIFNRVREHDWNTYSPLGGYIWCTTGGGKTLTSFKTGQLLHDLNVCDKVVFVVDRIDLNTQTETEYKSFSLASDTIRNPDSSKDLYDALKSDKDDDSLILTSIQKLSNIQEEKGVNTEDIRHICDKKIVFIFDEVQRSQNGTMHMDIKEQFKGALFFGFTGTPILDGNDNGYKTEDIFGPCLSMYTIASGIRDGNVLGFAPKQLRTYDDDALRERLALRECNVSSVEEAKADPKLKKKYLDIINRRMVDTVENGEPVQGIESMLPTDFYDNQGHREAVVNQILSDYATVSDGEKGTHFSGLLATESISEAIEYYKLFKQTDLRVTAVFDANIDNKGEKTLDKQDALVEIYNDYNKMFYGTDKYTIEKAKEFKTDVIDRLARKNGHKNIERDKLLDIVIVVNQLLTGFDSQYLIVLYLDKVIDKHNLIQAISRTNRVYDREEKPYGLFRFIRKPYTMKENLEEALKLYCGRDEDAKLVCLGDNKELVRELNEIYQGIKTLFEEEGIKNFYKLPKAQERRQKFRKEFSLLLKLKKMAKLQGYNIFKDTDYPIDFSKDEYEILYARYEDCMPDRERREKRVKSSLNVSTSASSVELDRIDTDYIEKLFKEICPILISPDVEDEEKRARINALIEQAAKLSEKDQKIAGEILKQIQDGRIEVEEEKTLKKYIAEYKEKRRNNLIRDFAKDYGLDETLLVQMLQSIEGSREEKLSYKQLFDSRQKGKAEEKLNNTGYILRGLLEKEIRELREIII